MSKRVFQLAFQWAVGLKVPFSVRICWPAFGTTTPGVGRWRVLEHSTPSEKPCPPPPYPPPNAPGVGNPVAPPSPVGAGVTAGCGLAAGAVPPPRPNSAPSDRKVRALRLKLAFTAVRNGSKRALSVPTVPFHRLWVICRLNPGSKSDENVFDSVDVVQPVWCGCFACSKL